MGLLVVQRPQEWFGVLRDLKVIVDGKRVGGLRPRQYLSMDLPDGRHTVQGRMDWCTCRPFEVSVFESEATFVELSIPFRSFVKAFALPTRAIKVQEVPGRSDGTPLP